MLLALGHSPALIHNIDEREPSSPVDRMTRCSTAMYDMEPTFEINAQRYVRLET